MENISKQEQIIRKVTEIGNGAHIFAPKEWVNEKVLIIRLEKKTIKDRILEILYPHLDKIISVLLYGSHARNEADQDSDVDILIIAKEKFKIENQQGMEFIVISENSLDSAIKTNPIMMYSIIKEAKPMINSSYLETLTKIKINSKLFKPFIDSTKSSISSSQELIELDKKTGKTASNSVLYSLILRLRGVFIISRLLNNKEYSNALFKKFLTENCKIDYDKIYEIYRTVRDNKELKDLIPINQEEVLLAFLEQETKKLEKLV